MTSRLMKAMALVAVLAKPQAKSPERAPARVLVQTPPPPPWLRPPKGHRLAPVAPHRWYRCRSHASDLYTPFDVCARGGVVPAHVVGVR